MGEDELKMTLPWPPTVNTYWRQHVLLPKKGEFLIRARQLSPEALYQWVRKNTRVIVFTTDKAKKYTKMVREMIEGSGLAVGWDCEVAMKLRFFPPDRRKRDESNYLKVLEDALEAAGVLDDDSQIKEHHLRWRHAIPGGQVKVVLRKLSDT